MWGVVRVTRGRVRGLIRAGASVVLLGSIYAGSGHGVASAQTTQLSDTEQFVVRQAVAGEVADLADRSDRVVRATLLTELLTHALPGVSIHRHGVRIAHATINGDLDLSGAEIDSPVVLSASQLGTLTIDHANLHKTLDLTSSTIQALSATSAVLNEDLVLNTSTILGTVYLAGVSVKGDILAAGAEFQDTLDQAVWNRAKVTNTVILNDAVFKGSADFGFLTAGHFEAIGAQFTGPGMVLNFRGMQINGSVLLNQTRFAGPVNINSVTANQVEVTDSHFDDPVHPADLGGMKIASALLLGRTTFRGPVSLADSAATQFDATYAHFTNPNAVADFSGLRITGVGLLKGIGFAGPVSLARASFGQVVLSGTSWPLPPQRVDLSAMAFHDIRTDSTDAPGQDTNDWPAIKRVFDRAVLWTGNYVDLEGYYRGLGRLDEADAAFIEGQQKQRVAQVGPSLSSVSSWLFDIALCYGRCPVRVLIPIGLFLGIGLAVFSQTDMQPAEPDKPAEPPGEAASTAPSSTHHGDAWPKYNRFWYTLDLFAPVITLHVSDKWVPQKGRWKTLHYTRVHSLAGWVLVPVLVAALTGLLK